MQTVNIDDHPSFQQDIDTYIKILSWAHLNFELQILLQHNEISTQMQYQLQAIGYQGEIPNNRTLLFEDDGFFSTTQTSQRIATFTLKEVGLNKKLFEQAEKGIQNAYDEIKEKHNILLDKSLKQTLQALSVFRP